MHTRSRKRILTASLLVTTGLLGATPAFAQSQPVEGTPEVADDQTQRDQEIVVTGSRIARPDLEQSSPVAVISAEEFGLQTAINVEDVLNDMPQIIPATTGTSNNPGGGIATVDLRGLSPQRTLVLVDGRRYIYYDADQIVDLNTIPAALIDRVDVVTGGRSAVYGSDAIAGVVNFITRRDFAGIELNGSYEISNEGDGGRYNVDGTIGANFDDNRGNVVLHAGYFRRNEIFAGQRPETRVSFSDAGNGTLFPGGSSSTPDFRFALSGLNARLGLPSGNLRFGPGGTVVPFNTTTDLYNFGPVNYLQVPQERFLMFSKATYEINESFKPYLQAQFINNRVTQQLAPTPVGNATPFRGGSLGSNLQVQVRSPFFAPNVQTALAGLDTDNDGYVAIGSFGGRFTQAGGRVNEDDRSAYRFVAGMEGDIGGGWSYDGYYLYARTKNSQVQSGNIQLSALLAATRTAFQNPTTGAVSPFPFAGVAGGGTLVCADAAARANGCVPANIFGAGQLTPAAIDYLTISATNLEEAETQVASMAVTNGNLFDFGSGPVGVAFGVEHRRERAEFIPDTFLSSGDVGGFNAGNPTSGSYNLTEVFGEINVPILTDTFIRRLEFNGAARYSDYSNAVGGVFTWAAGGLLEPFEGLTLRGQYQQAIRGPSVNELFQGETVSFDGAVDPCTTSAAASGALREACIRSGVPAAVVGTNYGSGSTSFPALQGGNPDLEEERAETYTLGAVFVPSFLRNFSLTVDYYNISIENAIGTVGAQNIVDACLRFGQDEYCDLIERAPTGEFQRFVDLNFNAASLETSGIDIGANLRVPTSFSLMGAGESRFDFRFAGSRLLELNYVPVVGLPILNECAGRFGRTCSDTVAFGPTPEWRHSLRGTFTDGPLTLSVLWRHIGSSRDDDDTTLYGLEVLDAVDYFDFTLQFEVNDNYTFTLGIDNVFDQGFQPCASTQQGGNCQQSNTYPATYDTLGRYFSAAVRVRF